MIFSGGTNGDLSQWDPRPAGSLPPPWSVGSNTIKRVVCWLVCNGLLGWDKKKPSLPGGREGWGALAASGSPSSWRRRGQVEQPAEGLGWAVKERGLAGGFQRQALPALFLAVANGAAFAQFAHQGDDDPSMPGEGLAASRAGHGHGCTNQ